MGDMGDMGDNIASLCRYHVVFCPTYRRTGLMPPRDERLKVLLAEQIAGWGHDLIELAVMPHHAQLLVGCDPPVGIHRSASTGC
jgi:putative transposase